MAKKDAAKALPRLRFPEFRGEEGWVEKPLSMICDRITQGGTPDTAKPEYWIAEIDWLTPAEMGKTDDPFIYSTMRKISKRGLENCPSELLPSFSVVLSTRAPIGHVVINYVPMAINQGCKGLVPAAGLKYRFLFYSLVNAKSRLVDLGAGNTFKELSGSALKIFTIPVPNLDEQQKIADCLGSLDELIVAQGRKVEALKARKRGFMQVLFPREGETTPRLRFPEFRDGPEWKWRTLIDACHMQAGKFITASQIKEQYKEGLYPCYGGNGLRGYTETYTHSGEFPLIGRQGALCGNVRLGTGDFYATEHAVVVQPKKGIAARWLYYVIDLLDLNRFATGQAQPGLSVEVLEKVPVMIPNQEKEQQRIASCLTSIDSLIAAETDILETLKIHKKGLMQGLFPATEEIS